jgi:hypothetical protein
VEPMRSPFLERTVRIDRGRYRSRTIGTELG